MNTDKINSPDPTYLLEEGMTINNKWEIQNFIAKGGKGEVYLARQLNLDRQVALKIMSREFIKSLEGDEEELTSETQRFRREVKVMARMQHPNILQVYDFDQLEMDGMEMDYIVMEYIPGLTLRQKMPKNGFGHDENKVKKWIKRYFFPILDGMKAVHDKGVVHRDMKPENVLIDDELPRIMDFGIAGGYHMDNVTQTHHMLGTMTYMPEEQFMDLALTDARVDVYALGKILYEVVEGKMKKGRDKPFHGVALNHPETRFFKALDQIIQQATAKNRNKRTPSVKNFHDALEELIKDSEREKGRVSGPGHTYWKYLFAAGIVAIIIFAGAVIWHHNPDKLTPDVNHIQKLPEIKKTADISLNLPVFQFKNPRPTSVPVVDKTKQLPGKFYASDNMTMILLKGSKVELSIDDPAVPGKKQPKKIISVKTVYMDRTKITNHLYVQFLNEVDGIEVKNKSVLRKGQLLLLLGEIREGYEPIIFKQGRFMVTSDDVSRPVVRVTPVGALAYAYFYGKSLPLMEQWWLAVQTHQDKPPQESRPVVSQRQTGMTGGSWMMNGDWTNQNQSSEDVSLSTFGDSDLRSVFQAAGTSDGIQGLEQNVNEWTMSFSSDETPAFHIHGGVGELTNMESYLERQLWEAFSSVGFRTVLNLDGGGIIWL